MILVLLISFLLHSLILTGQESVWRIEIDTISTGPERSLVQFRTFEGELMTENSRAYLYPKVIRVRRYKHIPRFLFSKDRTIFLVHYEGLSRRFKPNGKRAKFTYFNGLQLEEKFFDSDGAEISSGEYNHALVCGVLGSTYLFLPN